MRGDRTGAGARTHARPRTEARPPAEARPRPRAANAPRHRAARVHPAELLRRRVAGTLLAAGAFAATLLTVTLDPAAPPAPDRGHGPGAVTSDVAQESGD
ncbi:hypothetical protein ACFY8W_13190 [Streptomyces sp. NPDC012637]|uniref:hypothetical protein n=1 Tax=Streptomyces sp. NPDC012637 TaxID=3364842 RepID=UPI0036EA53BE